VDLISPSASISLRQYARRGLGDQAVTEWIKLRVLFGRSGTAGGTPEVLLDFSINAINGIQ
jgi:hypothetical protein